MILNAFNRIKNDYTFPCLVFCAIIIAIIGILQIIPSRITQLFRPIFIVSCIAFRRDYAYPMTRTAKTILVMILYLTIILISHDITRSAVKDYASMVLFLLFFVFSTQRVWEKSEIKLFINLFVFVSLACALLLLYKNTNLREMDVSSSLEYLGHQKNRNAVAFSLVPGALCSIICLTNIDFSKNHMLALLYLSATVICSFTIIATGARSAAMSLIVGAFFMLWDKAYIFLSFDLRVVRKIMVILFFLILLFLLYYFTLGTHSARIFEDFGNNNGRDPLWDFAYQLIRDKPVFGGGFNYWRDMGGDFLGTHNTYLTIMVISGWVGAILLTALFIFTIIDSFFFHSFISLGFLAEVVFHTYSESSLDYYAIFPFILSVVFSNYVGFSRKRVSDLFQ